MTFKLLSLASFAAISGIAGAHQPGPVTPPAAAAGEPSSPATFVFGSEPWHEDSKILWDGFLNGLRGFEHFYNPVGNPIYFETPFNNTGVRFLYLHHDFPDDSQLRGGDLNVYAVQARIAITERLGFIATKDGYSDLNADALPSDDGWNDIAAGLKYAFYIDKPSDFIATFGGRYQMGNGDAEVLQGGVQEFSPFISAAKGWGKFHLIGDLTDRIPLDNDKGNNVFQWDVHADYEIFSGVAPMLELHGLHYLSDGDRTPLSVGGADYTNLGSTDVDGSTVIWLGAGARVKLWPNMSIGATFEYPLTNPDADIFGDRITVDLEFTW